MGPLERAQHSGGWVHGVGRMGIFAQHWPTRYLISQMPETESSNESNGQLTNRILLNRDFIFLHSPRRPLKIGRNPKGNEKVFQPSIFWCHVSFREGILLMAEILHQLIGSLSHYLQGLHIPGGAGFLPSTVFQPTGLFLFIQKSSTKSSPTPGGLSWNS